jgi:hypothetical protein
LLNRAVMSLFGSRVSSTGCHMVAKSKRREKLESLEERAVIANKSVLEAEKERDKLHKELDFIEVQLQGNRARTHDDTGDGHDVHAFLFLGVVRHYAKRPFSCWSKACSRVRG